VGLPKPGGEITVLIHYLGALRRWRQLFGFGTPRASSRRSAWIRQLMKSGQSGRGGAMALTTACPCDSSASYSRPSPRMKIHISTTANDPSRSNTTAQGKRKTLFTSKMPMASRRRSGNANPMISVDRLDRVYPEEVGREQGELREQLAHGRPNLLPTVSRPGLGSSRVQDAQVQQTSGARRLHGQRQRHPAAPVEVQRELETLAGLSLPSLGNREP
jgi:hypothetical protein